MAIVWRISPEKICSRIFNRLWLLVLITVGAPSCDAFASGVLYRLQTGIGPFNGNPRARIVPWLLAARRRSETGTGTYDLFWGYSPYYGHGSRHINMEHIFSGDIRHTMAMDQYISIHINMEHIITYLFWRYLP